MLLDLTVPEGPEGNDLDTLRAIRSAAPDVPVVVLTGFDEEIAARAIQLGAEDYVPSGSGGQIDTRTLVRTLGYGVERQEAARALRLSEVQHRNVLDQMRDGVLLSVGTTIVYANPACLTIYGIEAGAAGEPVSGWLLCAGGARANQAMGAGPAAR